MNDKNENNEISITPEEDDSSRTEKLKEKLNRCEAEKKEYLDGWQRAKADFINYRKDDGARMEDMARFIVTGLIQDILPVLDSFELGLRNNQQHDERGIELVRLQLLDILKKRGLEELAVAVGDLFNPEMHESIGEVESDAAHGTIAEEVQKGYRMQGKVIRPVRVRLAK